VGKGVVLVHDWLTGLRGGEKCLDVLARALPEATLHTLLYRKGKTTAAIDALRVVPSWLNRLPGVHRYYRGLLPLFPSVVEKAWRFPDAELVVSMSHCVAKAAQAAPGVPHVSYCFSPMRYAWQMRQQYYEGVGARGLKARVVDALLDRIRAWDLQTADRVTHFVAISNHIARRIEDCYGRESVVIYPPVDTDYYTPADHGEQPPAREDFYLVVSALAPYKRFDLAISACQRLGRRLVVIGSGQAEASLKKIAGPETTFLGWQPDSVIRDHLRRTTALLFPGEEDFGIVPVEAQACGAPVIALGRGGAAETVRDLGSPGDATGVLFAEPEVDSLVAAMERFERNREAFEAQAARRQAERFSTPRFERELLGYLAKVGGGLGVSRAA
jgi:glycosyltransferase involved in cell wall biosynthesis